MQPTRRQVPPKRRSMSMQAVLRPSCAARIAATYPPGPAPMTMTSNCEGVVSGTGGSWGVRVQGPESKGSDDASYYSRGGQVSGVRAIAYSPRLAGGNASTPKNLVDL